MKTINNALRSVLRRAPIRIAALCVVAWRLTSPASADEVTDWNANLLNALHVANTSPGAAPRLAAIVHGAIFDAVNGIERRYTPVHVTDTAPRGASRRAAAVMAGYTTLVGLFPTQKADLDEKLIGSVQAIASAEASEHSQSIERGLAWGEYVGHEILNWRKNDGSAPLPTPFLGGSDVGEWRPTPPGFLAGAGPQFATMATWVLNSPSQFRPDGPPALDSAAYAADYNEVKTMGSVNSAFRTADQTLYCKFWHTGTSTYNFNAVAERLSEENNLTLTENARLFAHLNIAQADAIIACFDAKYLYVFWRPVTAIRLGDTDGNAQTEADPNWTPLLVTPNHPEYISGHSTISAASVRVLQRYFGNDTPIFVDSDAMPGVIRNFQSLEDSIEEVANARVYGGIHYRSACKDGRGVGAQVGDFVVDNALVPRK